MEYLKNIICDFEKTLFNFANCEKDLRGSMPHQEQLRIFKELCSILDDIKKIYKDNN